MDLLQWPAIRKTYAGIDNPLFIDDIALANQGALSGLAALAGFGPADFWIVSGMEYNAPAGGPNTYNPGVFYLNGSFYYIENSTIEGQYLTPSVQGVLSEAFDDGNTRVIYNTNFGISSVNNTGAGPYSPLMSGPMNAYRAGNKYLATAVISLLATQANLGGAAFLNVGQIAGTVAAGNDPRMPYTQPQLDAKYAQIVNVIVKGDTNAYTPINPLDPVNKKYVDATSANKRAAGVLVVGNVAGGGTEITVSYGFTMPDTNYIPMLTVISLSASGGTDVVYAPMARVLTTTSFNIYLREPVGNDQNINVAWIIFGL